MDSKTCDVKTCEASMKSEEATVVRIGNKEYDLCKDCAAIFFKWLEGTFSGGRDVSAANQWIINGGTIITDGTNLPYWSHQPNTTPVNPYPSYPQITWTATDPKDMNSNWLNCSTSFKN